MFKIAQIKKFVVAHKEEIFDIARETFAAIDAEVNPKSANELIIESILGQDKFGRKLYR